MQELQAVFGISILIMSVVIHEVSHGYAALRYGDQTAKVAGRLTLNPLRHLDPIGSVVIPAILILTHAPFPFGWARPVPYNPRNLTGGRKAELVVASAGIISNLAIAVIFGIFLRVLVAFGFYSDPLLYISSIIILVNVGLAIFNLLPVPPLDGSKIIFALLPARLYTLARTLERYAFSLVLILILILWKFDFISPLITAIYQLLTGIKLQ